MSDTPDKPWACKHGKWFAKGCESCRIAQLERELGEEKEKLTAVLTSMETGSLPYWQHKHDTLLIQRFEACQERDQLRAELEDYTKLFADYDGGAMGLALHLSANNELRTQLSEEIELSKHLSDDLQNAKEQLQAAERCVEDTSILIRRLCRVVAKHDANNTVRERALDYLHRKGLGGSPLKAYDAKKGIV